MDLAVMVETVARPAKGIHHQPEVTVLKALRLVFVATLMIISHVHGLAFAPLSRARGVVSSQRRCCLPDPWTINQKIATHDDDCDSSS